MATLQGSLVAIVTPMQEGGELDLDAFRKLIDWHIREGTDGIVVVGTTGESPTVDVEEHCLLIKTVVEHVAKRVPVIAGTGANSTREAIELSAYARKSGAFTAACFAPGVVNRYLSVTTTEQCPSNASLAASMTFYRRIHQD